MSSSGRVKSSGSTSGSSPAASAPAPIPAATASPVSEGDWICPEPECANLNFARRSACNRCGKDKPIDNQKKKCVGIEIGKAAAEKSRGLFSADDWQCTKCGNVNWARRSSCNVCNAPKFKEVEERTGYGGGYNDRGVVEYIEREESDDEYDEFGRKKKQFRKIKSGESQSEYDLEKAKAGFGKDVRKDSPDYKRLEESNENDEDEEEDDEDDDGDLSKYDLSDWGTEKDDTNEKETKTEKEENPLKLPDSSLDSSKRSESSSGSTNNRHASKDRRSGSRDKSRSRSRSRTRQRRSRSRSRSRDRKKSRSRSRDRKKSRSRSRDRERKNRSRSRDRGHRSRDKRSRSRSRSRGKDRKHRSRSRDRKRR